tara:strand:+ start:1688 stop:2062 length:375 start_codon:yes stop_codon:yes gene_type:complete
MYLKTLLEELRSIDLSAVDERTKGVVETTIRELSAMLHPDEHYRSMLGKLLSLLDSPASTAAPDAWFNGLTEPEKAHWLRIKDSEDLLLQARLDARLFAYLERGELDGAIDALSRSDEQNSKAD